jgi:hypothetical protein
MYEILVQDPEDVLAALAYTAYKQHEFEVMSKIQHETQAPPTAADMEQFYRAASAPAMIEMYMQRAELLSNAFLTSSLETKYSELEAAFINTSIGRQLSDIRGKQDERRTWKGWVADSLGNLTVNFVTILLIAAAVTGYRALDQLNGHIGKVSGVAASEPSDAKKQTVADPSRAPASAN